MRSLLLALTLTHPVLLFLMFRTSTLGGPGLWVVGTLVALVGMVIPFFIPARTELRWTNLLPGLLLLSGWGSWVLLVITNAENPINIWGVIGPVLGVFFQAGVFLLSLVVSQPPRQTNTDPALS